MHTSVKAVPSMINQCVSSELRHSFAHSLYSNDTCVPLELGDCLPTVSF